MTPILRNILAVVAGWLGGSIVNMGLVKVGTTVFPIEGIDPNDMEAFAEIASTLSAEHFIFPFLAHALGTLLGAALAARIAVNHHMKFALGIGGLFLLGGIAASFMIPAPGWFIALDLVLAYLPMAWIGGKWGTPKK
jgi:hypothetical protein